MNDTKDYTWWQDKRTTWWFYGRKPFGASIVYIAASINLAPPPFKIDIHDEGMFWAYSRAGIDYATLEEAMAVAEALVAMR